MIRKRGWMDHAPEVIETSDGRMIVEDEPLLEPHDGTSKAKSSGGSTFWPDFALLTLLYALQGVPLGLAGGSLPFLLKAAGASYAAVGLFSFALLPFSLKLCWAPVVDGYWVASL